MLKLAGSLNESFPEAWSLHGAFTRFQLVPVKLPFYCCSIRPVGKLTFHSVKNFSESLKNASSPSIKFLALDFLVLHYLETDRKEVEDRQIKQRKKARIKKVVRYVSNEKLFRKQTL